MGTVYVDTTQPRRHKLSNVARMGAGNRDDSVAKVLPSVTAHPNPTIARGARRHGPTTCTRGTRSVVDRLAARFMRRIVHIEYAMSTDRTFGHGP